MAMTQEVSKGVEDLRKEISQTIPEQHNVNLQIFAERLYLRGVRVTRSAPR